MAERKQMEMLSALMGEQGQDALQMMRRMERLKRLIGTEKSAEQIHLLPKMQEKNVFCSHPFSGSGISEGDLCSGSADGNAEGAAGGTIGEQRKGRGTTCCQEA